MSWSLLAQMGGAAFLALVGYLCGWRHLHRAPARGLTRLTGRLQVDATIRGDERDGPYHLLTPGGQRLRLDLASASLRVLPGPWDHRRSPALRCGDQVVVHGCHGPPRGFTVLQLIRTGWREPGPWLEPAAALSALLALVAVSRAQVSLPEIVKVWPAAAPRLADRPGPEALRQLTRRIDPYYPFSGDRPPPALEPGRAEGLHEYIASDPRTVEGQRQRLYLQPIGVLSPGQRRALALAADFMTRYFCLPVVVTAPIPLSEIPDENRRVHQEWGIPQLQSTALIHEVLRARLPRDAAGLLGVTAVDLWPGRGWQAVRGQASPIARVGIASLYRTAPADLGAEAFRLFLRRTLKLLVHEAGHILSMGHCPHDGCVMSGRNETEVADLRHPLLCPECLAKLVWATGCDPAPRHRALARFCRAQGLPEEAALFQVLADALRGW